MLHGDIEDTIKFFIYTTIAAGLLYLAFPPYGRFYAILPDIDAIRITVMCILVVLGVTCTVMAATKL